MEYLPLIKPITSLFQALVMRRIRNEVRAYLTGNSQHISFVGQVVWYFRVYKPAFEAERMVGYLLVVDGKAIGYGLIRLDHDRWWVTGAILKKWRGRGFGRVLFNHLTVLASNYAHRDAWLRVFKWNQRAIKLYTKLGYKPVFPENENKKIQTMKWVP
jgi:GNAT superfamily N-acetyltransferase